MATAMEKLLRLTADYHNFCKDAQVVPAEMRDEELALDELDLISAAGNPALWNKGPEEET